MKKTIRVLSFVILILSTIKSFASIITTLNKTDPNPIFTCQFPYDYLYVNEKEFKKGRTNIDDPLRFSFTASPFYQRADNGKDLYGRLCELGDVSGKWNILAFLPYGGIGIKPTVPDLPEGKTFPPEMISDQQNLLGCIKQAYLYNGGSGAPSCPTGLDCTNTDGLLPMPDQLKTIEGLISLQDTPRTSQSQLFGFLSVPIRYRKRGVRFEAMGKIFGDFGFAAQTGVAKISQTSLIYDQINCPLPIPCTTNSTTVENCGSCIANGGSCNQSQALVTCANPFQTNPDTAGVVGNDSWYEILNCLSRDVTNRLQDLAASTGNGLCNYNKTSMEDIHAELFWRHAFEIETPGLSDCLSCGLFIPFVTFGADIPTGAKSCPDQIFSVPFGNNGHYALRFNAGCTFDFTDTIEIGGHSGVTYFFEKTFDQYRMPNNMFQNGIYPFTTSAEVKPGPTWHVGLVMNAYHFMDCLSFYGEYLYIAHERDKIRLLEPDPVWQPGLLECKSAWNVQLFNFGFNYDVSRNFRLGALMQIPVDRVNAYKSTTYMLSVDIVF